MKNYVITCSSTCDLTSYYLRKHNVYYVSFYYYLDNEKFYDNFYDKHTPEEFFEKIKTTDVRTSQPDPEQYKELWTKLIKQGNDILHIELSSGISGAVNSARIAKSMVEEEFKDAKIYVVDSLIASSGYGLLVDKAVREKENGKTIDELYEFIENIKKDVNAIFAIGSLEQLIKGGRVSKLVGGIGKMLNIVLIMHEDAEGKLNVIKKVRGMSNAIDEIYNIVSSNIYDGDNYNDKIFICNSLLKDLSIDVYQTLKSKYKNIDSNYDDKIFNIGTTIGAHTGEKVISVFYFGKGKA